MKTYSNLPKMQSSTRGFGLVELLVVLVIASVLVLKYQDFFKSKLQGTGSQNFAQDTYQLQQLISSAFMLPGTCDYHLANKVINVSSTPTKAQPSPTVLEFTELKSSGNPSSPAIVQVHQRIPSSISGLIAKKISFTQIYSAGPPNVYNGTFLIEFQSPEGAHAISPVQIAAQFSTQPTDPQNAQHILKCASAP